MSGAWSPPIHALPGEEHLQLVLTLRRISSQTPVLALSFSDVRFLGHGVAIEVHSPGLLALRKRLASEWEHWPGAQDRASYRPRIATQNKVSASEARRLFGRIRRTWQPPAGRGEGLQIWHCRGGPWELAGTLACSKNDASY
jgi:hypothetical protein